MNEPFKKPYLDSCTFISFLLKENITGVPRGHIIKQLLTLAEQNHFHIYTSVLSITETCKSHQLWTPPGDVRQTMRFFEQPFIRLIAADRDIAELAAEYSLSHKLKPMDALHLASAVFVRCDIFLTWDDHFKALHHPPIVIRTPEFIGTIPIELDE